MMLGLSYEQLNASGHVGRRVLHEAELAMGVSVGVHENC